MDLNKMKVNDLKAELAARNLDTKGVKAVLVERLKEAFEKENSFVSTDSAPVTESKMLDVGTPCQSTPVRRSRRRSMTRSPSPSKTNFSQLKSVSEEEEEDKIESVELSSARKKRRTRSITKSPTSVIKTEVKLLDVLEEEELDIHAEKILVAVTSKKPEQVDMNDEATAKKPDATPTKHDLNQTSTSILPNDNERSITEAKATSEGTPVTTTTDIQSDLTEIVETENVEAKECTSEAHEANYRNKQTTDNQHGESFKSEKGDLSTKSSSSKTLRTNPAETAIEFLAEENEPVIDNSKVLLSWYDSDLNLEIDPKTFDVAKPCSDGALSLLWAAARANRGVTMGKIAYEVILTRTNQLRKVTDEPVTSEFRIGWSTANANLQLGEAKHSFAYKSTGLKGTDSTFTEYGIEYNINDVVGVYLDLDSSLCKIEYTINNVKQGTAFEFKKEDLEGKALYPHICTKNIAFKVNFGQFERSLLNDRVKSKAFKNEDKHIESSVTTITKQEDADADPSKKMDKLVEMQDTETPIGEKKIDEKNEASINPEYVYIAQSPIDNLVHGPYRPESRNECELIFIIGLPASGKTHWVQNYVRDNTHKKTTILSVDTLLDQMRLSGEPRKPANTKNWSRLVNQLSKSLNKLIEVASKRRRNIIIDQTNVFSSEQIRKLRGFGEYGVRRAIIVVPDEKEHERRIKQQYDDFGGKVQEQHLNVMKAHFHIPSKELNWFTQITYAELEEENAIERVKELNESGKTTLPHGFNRNQQQRRAAINNRGRKQGKKRYSSIQQHSYGGYNPHQQRYSSTQHHFQNRNYRAVGGYGRRDSGAYTVGHYGSNTDWPRGRYGNLSDNRSGRNRQVQRYGGNNREYNTGSGWNQQNSNCWSYGGNQNNATQQWYSWWQSNLKNLLQHQGVDGGNSNAQQVNNEQYWSEHPHQRNYGQSYGSGSFNNK